MKRDPSYDRLEFENSSGSFEGIVLQGHMIINNQPAQDRIVAYSHLVKSKSVQGVPANCVQSTQGGHFNVSKLDHDSFMMLPPTLREVALRKADYNRSSYSNLWSTLDKWCGTNCNQQGLHKFYTQFEDKLNLFVAQFEPVKNQLGAIVLINDEVVAIDIVPKYETWKHTWRAFIRDSYGAEAVRQIETNGEIVSTPMINMEKVNSMATLREQYDNAKTKFQDDLKDKVSAVSQLQMARSVQEKLTELTMCKVDCSDYIGQAVYHGDHVVYMSLVTSKASPKAKTKFKSLRNNPYGGNGLSFS